MKTTKEQKETYNKCRTKYGFKYPCCNSEVISNLPIIENKGELKTQIHCPYCRMFLYIDDYI